MSHPCCICPKPAVGPYAGKSYCSEHRPYVLRFLNLDDMTAARRALSEGASLHQAAVAIGAATPDLDVELWRSFGQPRARRYQPDFVA